jgi:predicted acetyltransferase
VTVEVTIARRDEALIVANLMELYLCEFSATSQRDVGPDGRFGYRGLDAYWSDPGRYPFLIRAHDLLAGFALVVDRDRIDPGEPGHAVAEFFVLPRLRRRRIGTAAGLALFARFPGRWWVGERADNPRAVAFWRAVIGQATNGHYREETWDMDGEHGVAQIFESS